MLERTIRENKLKIHNLNQIAMGNLLLTGTISSLNVKGIDVDVMNFELILITKE